MKTKNRTILMFILVFTGITIFYSQGWTEENLTLGGFLPEKISFTCPNQGPGADRTVVVHVEYNKNGKLMPLRAEDKTDPKNKLKFRRIDQPYFIMRGKKPSHSPATAHGIGIELRVGKLKISGPPTGSIYCTKNNLPVLTQGRNVWFIVQDIRIDKK